MEIKKVSSIDVITDRTLSRYTQYNDRHGRLDHRRGRSDAEKGIPPLTEDYHPFRDEIIADATRRLQAYEMAVASYENDLQNRIDALTLECEDNYKKTFADLEEQKENTLRHLDATIGPSSSSFVHLKARKEAAEQLLHRTEARLQRPLRTRLRFFYIPLMIILAILEVPVNRLAFELFFQETPLLSLLISLMIGLILIFFCHLLGTWLTQAPHYDGKWARWSRYVGITLILPLVGLLIYFIAKLRQGYVLLIEQVQSQSFLSLLQQEGGAVEIAKFALDVPLDLAGSTLLLVNIAIVLTGALAAFVRHDPDPDYENAVRNAERSSRKLNKREASYEIKVARRRTEFDEKIRYLHQQIDRSEDRINQTRREMQGIAEHTTKIKRLVAKVLLQRLMKYQVGNQDGRSDGKIPNAFRNTTEDTVFARLEGEVITKPRGPRPVADVGAGRAS